jgi:hypothetical protein
MSLHLIIIEFRSCSCYKSWEYGEIEILLQHIIDYSGLSFFQLRIFIETSLVNPREDPKHTILICSFLFAWGMHGIVRVRSPSTRNTRDPTELSPILFRPWIINPQSMNVGLESWLWDFWFSIFESSAQTQMGCSMGLNWIEILIFQFKLYNTWELGVRK